MLSAINARYYHAISDSQVPQLLVGCWFPRHSEQVSRGTTDVLGWITHINPSGALGAAAREPCLDSQMFPLPLRGASAAEGDGGCPRAWEGAHPPEAQREGGPSSTLSVLNVLRAVMGFLEIPKGLCGRTCTLRVTVAGRAPVTSPSAGAPATLAEDGGPVTPGPGLQSPPGAVCPRGGLSLDGVPAPLLSPAPAPSREGLGWAPCWCTGRRARAQAAMPVRASAPAQCCSVWGMGRKGAVGPPLVRRIALNIMSGPCFSIITIAIVIAILLIAGRGRFVPSRAPYVAPLRRREPPFPVPPPPSMGRRAVGRHLGSGQAAWSSLAGWCFPGGDREGWGWRKGRGSANGGRQR